MAKKKLAINGFGRIGRLFLRAALEDDDFKKNFDVVAINDLTDSETLAYLMKYDSVHRVWGEHTVTASGTTMAIDGKEIEVTTKTDPLQLPWEDFKVDVVLEASGRFTSKNDASKHITAGAERVLISGPSKDADAVLVPGANMEIYNENKHKVVSMASCTTNSIAPVLRVLIDTYGIERGYLTTVHAYTNDQRILDLPNDKIRRSRAAALSIIPTSTGAASAIGQVIPELAGKMDGVSMRVPVACGSISDLTLEMSKKVTAAELNATMKKAANGKLKGILQYTEDEIVSSDVIGNKHTGIIDSKITSVLQNNGTFAKVFSWYDNEWGYSNKLVDLLKYMYKK